MSLLMRDKKMNNRLTMSDMLSFKEQGRKIVAVSCYDYTTAKLVSQSNVQMIIVGDSAAQVVLGYDSTLPATMDFMVAITAAVRRGAPGVFLVADMPFLSYQLSKEEALKNAARFITEAGAQMVKIEATSVYLDIIKAVSDAGMAVMAHIGIRPQHISKTGQLRAQARTAEDAVGLITEAENMLTAGAAALLLEGAATEVAQIITERSDVPVISCGSGPFCDGQVLIAPDILGLTQGPCPKFAKNFGCLADDSIKAFSSYAEQVQANKYPDDEHCYHMKTGELTSLKKILVQTR
jgi:3-methyl-2-oxobutanoate hydroxymethyltransferase